MWLLRSLTLDCRNPPSEETEYKLRKWDHTSNQDIATAVALETSIGGSIKAGNKDTLLSPYKVLI